MGYWETVGKLRKRALFGQLSCSDTQDAYNLRVTKIDDALFGTGDLRDFFDWFYEKEQPISKADSVRSVPTSEEHGGESEPGKKIFFLSSIQSFINLFSLFISLFRTSWWGIRRRSQDCCGEGAHSQTNSAKTAGKSSYSKWVRKGDEGQLLCPMHHGSEPTHSHRSH